MNPFRIQIKNSCQESWNNMRPENDGRFCFSCNKQVVDFSIMTEVQIRDFFSLNTSKVCGRFRKRQLDHVYPAQSMRNAPWYNSIFLKLALTTILTLKISDTEAQVAGISKEIVKDNSGKTKKSSQENAIKQNAKFSGRVVAEGLLVPLANAEVYIEKNKMGSTNRDGRFSFQVSAFLSKKDSVTVTVVKAGYISFSEKYSLKEITSRNFVLALREEEMMLMGDIEIQPTN